MGHVVGPRIYSAGPPVSQTGGHFDIRGLNEPNYYFLGIPDAKQFMEWGYLADDVAEVQKRLIARQHHGRRRRS